VADLGVIIVSYNSAQWLVPCLASVYAHAGGAKLDVVVVDNGSVDGSPDLVEREFPQARVLRSENRGFAYANNRGFETVDAPFVLFLNPDAEIREGTFADLLQLLRERPCVGLLGCRQVSGDGKLYPTIRRFPTPTRHLLETLGSERFPVRAAWMGERELSPAVYDRETECDWVSGSFMLARRDAVLAAGLMDERYFLYCEETDLCSGIKAAGWTVRYVPDMTILHYWGKDGYDERLAAQEAYARRQYMFKHQGALRRILCTAALALFYTRQAVDHRAGDPEAPSRRAAARAALRALLGIAPPPFGELSGPLRGRAPASGSSGR
jgi:GT2 family glycosyltransferase